MAINPAPGRWRFALRAAICMAVPVLVGWALGDTTAGLLATIGGFTSLYGSGRPYLNRSYYLAGVAAFFAVAVGLGVWASAIPLLGLATITVIAMVAVLVCHAFNVGPPGAYMFMLGCAAGTTTVATHLSPWHIGALVFAGGSFAWLAHMVGVFWRPRGPEVAAVADARAAVSHYLATTEDTDRHRAARSLHQAWITLIDFQPVQPRSDGVVYRLRGELRRLHRVFAAAMTAAENGTPPPDIDTEFTDAEPSTPGPLGRPGNITLLRHALTPGSESLRLTARVGVAVVLAGATASAFTMDHTYWAMAAAVLMLHQGFDWTRTLLRGSERLVGTLIGLALAGLILTWTPQGWWLVLTIAALQFTIEMFVVRNYAIAVIFITPAALTIASGGHRVADVGAFLFARGVDTVIGCGAALLVYWLALRRRGPAPLTTALQATRQAVDVAAAHLAAGAVTSAPARGARRDLQLRTLAMLDTYQAAISGSPGQRAAAERLWPTVASTERQAYQTLAACWQLEHR